MLLLCVISSFTSLANSTMIKDLSYPYKIFSFMASAFLTCYISLSIFDFSKIFYLKTTFKYKVLFVVGAINSFTSWQIEQRFKDVLLPSTSSGLRNPYGCLIIFLKYG